MVEIGAEIDAAVKGPDKLEMIPGIKASCYDAISRYDTQESNKLRGKIILEFQSFDIFFPFLFLRFRVFFSFAFHT